MASKIMFSAIYALIDALATKYEFDAKEATTFLGFDVNVDAKPKATRGRKPATDKKEVKTEKRIKRMTPTLGKQLTTALSNVELELTDALKKEFVKFVEDLDDETFNGCGLTDHMRHFAESKAPAKKSEEDTSPVVSTLEELKELKQLTETKTVGVFWDSENGQNVTGPAQDDDEDMSEVSFNKKDYVVGDNTGRVYESQDGKDVFVGFVGIGKFKAMKV